MAQCGTPRPEVINAVIALAFATVGTTAAVVGSHTLGRLAMRAALLYHVVDSALLLRSPRRVPGPGRLVSVLAHHALVVVGAITIPDRDLLFWNSTAVVEFSSFALNVSREHKRRWTNLVFLGSWVVCRCVFMPVLTAYAYGRAGAATFVLWGGLVLLSAFWTCEAVGLLPRWITRRWADV